MILVGNALSTEQSVTLLNKKDTEIKKLIRVGNLVIVRLQSLDFNLSSKVHLSLVKKKNPPSVRV